MNIIQFIDEYEASANKKNYVEKHITKRYLPFETKVALAEQIIKNTSHITPRAYALFVLANPEYQLFIGFTFVSSIVVFQKKHSFIL